ncbi:MAG: 16S rRNA (cytosine(1402)-N(4))-methyltransferase [Candidatus Peribacteria bacterium]|nr:MAG: 16S rRNA (cytosine(1402)-N(4))-methyltransferase [Candidatus Peribacteria bacterium]
MRNSRYHHTIMAQEVCDHIPQGAQWILDGTVGHGGHTLAMHDYLCPKDVDTVHLIGVDKDEKMLADAILRLSTYPTITLGHAAYDQRDEIKKIA